MTKPESSRIQSSIFFIKTFSMKIDSIYNDIVTIVASIIRNSSTPDDGEIVSNYVYG